MEELQRQIEEQIDQMDDMNELDQGFPRMAQHDIDFLAMWLRLAQPWLEGGPVYVLRVHARSPPLVIETEQAKPIERMEELLRHATEQVLFWDWAVLRMPFINPRDIQPLFRGVFNPPDDENEQQLIDMFGTQADDIPRWIKEHHDMLFKGALSLWDPYNIQRPLRAVMLQRERPITEYQRTNILRVERLMRVLGLFRRHLGVKGHHYSGGPAKPDGFVLHPFLAYRPPEIVQEGQNRAFEYTAAVRHGHPWRLGNTEGRLWRSNMFMVASEFMNRPEPSDKAERDRRLKWMSRFSELLGAEFVDTNGILLMTSEDWWRDDVWKHIMDVPFLYHGG